MSYWLVWSVSNFTQNFMRPYEFILSFGKCSNAVAGHRLNSSKMYQSIECLNSTYISVFIKYNNHSRHRRRRQRRRLVRPHRSPDGGRSQRTSAAGVPAGGDATPVPGVDQFPYTIVAGDDGTLVVATQAVTPITPQLVIINPAGQVGRLRTPPPAFAASPAAVWPATGGPGPTVAIVVPDPPSACGHVGVDLVNPLTGHLSTTDTNRTGVDSSTSERVDDLWWGADATLYAAVTLVACPDDNQTQQHRIWRLTGHSWQTIGPDMVTDARQIDRTTTVATLGVYATKVYVSSAFSPVTTDGQVVGMTTPVPPTNDRSMALRLGSSRCSRTALAERPPRFFTSASVTT